MRINAGIRSDVKCVFPGWQPGSEPLEPRTLLKATAAICVQFDLFMAELVMLACGVSNGGRRNAPREGFRLKKKKECYGNDDHFLQHVSNLEC